MRMLFVFVIVVSVWFGWMLGSAGHSSRDEVDAVQGVTGY
ncbi:hypothetical protein BTP_1791 [Burkholderia thailandensis Phuket 4W-1]|nr:hypothetical protein BTP_1791 [Burkholderia thailandensis Phuket 4W-1]